MIDLEVLAKLVEDGFAARKIARDFNANLKGVESIIDSMKLSPLKEKFEEGKISRIVDLYSRGVSAKTLGLKFGIDKRRVQRWADAAGVLRTLGESRRLKFVDEHAFDNVQNPNQAYWLGFLYADGYNSERKKSVSISLKGDDYGHVKKYVKFFEGEENDIVLGYIEDGEKKYKTASYKINSEHLSLKLKELGCPQAKSFIIKFPDWIREDLKTHFIRGYFDGDGSIKVSKNSNEWRINICSTKDMCDSISLLIKEKLNIKSSITNISKTENNTSVLAISGNEQIRKFCDWMYKDSHSEILLDRKYERYLKLCEQQNNRKFLKSSNRSNYILTEEENNNIKADMASGMSDEDVMNKYGVSIRIIRKFK